MTTLQDDVIRVASGPMVSIQQWKEILDDAGIHNHVVGDELTGGVGTVVPDPIELWVHREDADQADALIRDFEDRLSVNTAPDPGAGGVD